MLTLTGQGHVLDLSGKSVILRKIPEPILSILMTQVGSKIMGTLSQQFTHFEVTERLQYFYLI